MSGVTSKEEDKKPAVRPVSSTHINLKVNSQDGNELFFRINRSTKLKKLMDAYCERMSVDIRSLVFLLDGRLILGKQTPDELEMQDEDEIDVMLPQTGGGVAQ